MSARIQLLALVHDAHEAYVGDINTPLKRSINGVFAAFESKTETAVMAAIAVRPPTLDEERIVKTLDLVALATEARCLMVSRGDGWGLTEHPSEDVPLVLHTPEEGAVEWLKTYQTLTACLYGLAFSPGKSGASMTEPTAGRGPTTGRMTETPTERLARR